MREIPQAAVDFIAKAEGVKLVAYPDPATGGEPWTIGVGHASGVKPGDKITRVKAMELLRGDLETAAKRLSDRIGDVVNELTENQYAALLSFVLNLGANPSWTIWKRLKARQFDQVPGEIIKFVNANGRKIQGLVNRRTAEIKLWSTDEPGSTDEPMTIAASRAADTPPTATDPVPPQKSATIITAITAAATGVPVAISQVTAAVAPYQDKSEIVQKIVATLATLGAIAAIVVLVLTWLTKRQQRR